MEGWPKCRIRALSFPVALLAVFLLTLVWAVSQTHAAGKAQHHVSRRVSLDAVLSCPSDPLIREVFHTDGNTAIDLNATTMIMARYHQSYRKTIPDYSILRTKMFFTGASGGGASDITILPTNAGGHIIGERKLPFCHDDPVAEYKSLASGEFPLTVEISATGWSLNANEIFVHADQFKFSSGVFSDSSEVYFTASKGNTLIQFVPTNSGLRFYRVIYMRPYD